MKTMMAACLTAGAMVAGVAQAQSGADLLKAKGCLGCHAFDKKKVGPAFNDVAGKYRGNAGATGELAAKMASGKGHPKVKVSEAEAKATIEAAAAGQ